MKRILNLLTVAFAFCALTAWAADIMVQKAQVYGPGGPVYGKIVMFGDRMVFVDDDNPDLSFVVPKRDIRAARMEGGRLTIDLSKPYEGTMGGDHSNVVLVMPDQSSAGSIVSWIGVPVAGISDEASRVVRTSSGLEITDVTFDIRNGDQKGKLIVRPDVLQFESLSDGKHSRRWAYADIRELTHNDHEIKLQPYHGDKYEFQFRNKAMLQTAYDLLSDRVVAARTQH